MNENGALIVSQTRRNRGSFCFGNHVAKHLPLILSNIVGNFFEVSMGATRFSFYKKVSYAPSTRLS